MAWFKHFILTVWDAEKNIKMWCNKEYISLQLKTSLTPNKSSSGMLTYYENNYLFQKF